MQDEAVEKGATVPATLIPARPEDRLPRPARLDPAELTEPGLATAAKLVYNSVVRLFHDPPAIVLGASFLLVMLWGHHGRLELISEVWDGWRGPGSDPATRGRVIPGLAWDQEAISFLVGCLLFLALPLLLIVKGFGQRPADYGLALPPPKKRRLALVSAIGLLVFAAPAFLFAAGDDQMQATYPLFRGDFASTLDFAAYEVVYFSFFAAVEFMFRGFLLFGVYHLPGLQQGAGDELNLRPAYYAVLVSMLSYTAWHLGKPPLELWGTLAWGVTTGSIALLTRSILAIVLVHWLLNLLLDLAIWQGWFG